MSRKKKAELQTEQKLEALVAYEKSSEAAEAELTGSGEATILKEYDEALSEPREAISAEPSSADEDILTDTIFEIPEISGISEMKDLPEAQEKEEGADEAEAIAELRTQIDTLKAEIERLEALKKAQNRILAEIGDFVVLFPDIPIESIPDNVWESVKQGAPLAASYALYEKKMLAEAKRAAEINASNARRSPGAAGSYTASEYFSPEDVRRMSRAEVHANYSRIKESMKKWT